MDSFFRTVISLGLNLPRMTFVTVSSPFGFFILPVGVFGEIPTRTRANFSVFIDFIIDSNPLCPPDDLSKDIFAVPNGKSRSSYITTKSPVAYLSP